MARKRLEVRQTDGEERVEAPFKFDRIVANLILHIVPDPVKMMKNLWEQSEEGCLLGVSIWGKPENNNFFSLFWEAEKAKNQKEGK